MKPIEYYNICTALIFVQKKKFIENYMICVGWDELGIIVFVYPHS